MSHISRLLIIALFTQVAVATTWGQNQLISVEGQFVGVRGQLMQVKGSDAQMYLVLLPKEPNKIQYSGTAAAGWLRPGVFVRFSGMFDDRGVGQEPILEMEAFTPNPRRPPRPDQLADVTPGIYPAEAGGGGGAAALFGGEAKVQPKQVGPSKYRIVGRVAGLGRKGELGVMTGPRQIVQVQLTEETRIKLEMEGAQFAMPGDRVVVEGYANPPTLTNVTANSVQIEAAELLGQVAAKPVRKTAKQRREEAAAKKAEADKPAAEMEADENEAAPAEAPAEADDAE
ncbi:hypothetical protein [Rosistilla oblonga]|uniref:DUF5666 domain-containing protein n=1 Tax=Rosistilla oblonga TaxID=2527990 RepID=A0A518IW41_9BACT|nr:hypothetical protein [Rosistilla oblonga]QDV57311.1 hypothetical protein Mal33_33150 [Rosistilla oblonga]